MMYVITTGTEIDSDTWHMSSYVDFRVCAVVYGSDDLDVRGLYDEYLSTLPHYLDLDEYVTPQFRGSSKERTGRLKEIVVAGKDRDGDNDYARTTTQENFVIWLCKEHNCIELSFKEMQGV